MKAVMVTPKTTRIKTHQQQTYHNRGIVVQRIFIGLLSLLLLASHDVSAQLKMTRVNNGLNFYRKDLDLVNYQQTEFCKYVNFGSASLNKKTTFFLCTFNKFADFGSTVFQAQAEFSNDNFNSLANYLRAIFRDDTQFLGDTFNDELNLESAEFDHTITFQSDTFKGRAAFLYARFKGPADFGKSVFKGKTTFSGARFYEDAFFDGATFNGPVDFSNTVFYKNLHFSNIKTISERIDLTEAKTDYTPNTHEKRGINLTNSDISKFKLDYNLYYLVFDSTATFEYRSNVYQSLLNNFKNDGYTESYELLDKEYRTFLYSHKNEHFFLWLDQQWWDFGYSKYYIFYWILGLLGVFTFLNLFFYPALNNSVYEVNDVKPFHLFKTPKKIPAIFYYSLVYTSVLFFSLSVKLENLKYKHWYGVIYIFIIYLTGIVCIAYLANFVIAK